MGGEDGGEDRDPEQAAGLADVLSRRPPPPESAGGTEPTAA